MITIKSHGFKFSRPEANVVFDVSYFKNPWRDEKIRKEKNEAKRHNMIMKFMEKQDNMAVFIKRVNDLLRYYALFHPDENITVAFCCSAGEYRSPAIAFKVSEELKKLKIDYKLEQSENSKL